MISQHILIKDSSFQSSQKKFCIPLLDSLILKLLSSPLSLVCSNSSTQTWMYHWLLRPFDCVGILLLGDNQWERQAGKLGSAGHRWMGPYPSAHPHLFVSGWKHGNKFMSFPVQWLGWCFASGWLQTRTDRHAVTQISASDEQCVEGCVNSEEYYECGAKSDVWNHWLTDLGSQLMCVFII